MRDVQLFTFAFRGTAREGLVTNSLKIDFPFRKEGQRVTIHGDPGADSGAEDENQNGREKIRRAKVRKKNTSRIFLSYFCSSNFFPPVLIFVFGPTICPWVPEDEESPFRGACFLVFLSFHSIQQYSRRDCLEISGIPILPLDSPANLTQELGQLIGVTLDKQDISIAHRLPDTKSKKNRFIVKFIRREKRDEFYKSRKHLGGKKASELPSVACEMGKSIHQDSVMYINESLTQYRSELFGRINKFKKDNKYKFLWTNNGKIYLRKHETSQTFTFTTFDEFDEFTTPSH